jgi:hypothetical protein
MTVIVADLTDVLQPARWQSLKAVIKKNTTAPLKLIDNLMDLRPVLIRLLQMLKALTVAFGTCVCMPSFISPVIPLGLLAFHFLLMFLVTV